MKLFGCVCVLLAAATDVEAGVQSLDDVRYWVGAGSQRAALALDWDGDSPSDTALVWGYRWDGAASAEEMLREVLAADARLFAKLGANELGVALLGAGYDLNDDGAFAIDDGTTFDADGVALASFSNADGGASVDPDDLYREGWESGYWHYGVGVGSPPVWSTSGLGPTDTPLVEGSWHGLAFAVTLLANEFPQNLVAASPPLTGPDFSGDGLIDAADYTLWRDAGGSGAAYAAWTAAYGGGALVAVPEPAALVTTALLLGFRSLLPRDS